MRRRPSQRPVGVPEILAAMRQGATLRLHRDRQYGDLWTLSNGVRVEPPFAQVVLQHPHVAGAGDALFADAPCQTYRIAGGD